MSLVDFVCDYKAEIFAGSSFFVAGAYNMAMRKKAQGGVEKVWAGVPDKYDKYVGNLLDKIYYGITDGLPSSEAYENLIKPRVSSIHVLGGVRFKPTKPGLSFAYLTDIGRSTLLKSRAISGGLWAVAALGVVGLAKLAVAVFGDRSQSSNK